MSEDILHFSVCFHGAEGEYLNGRGSGCTMHGMLEPVAVLNAILCLGHTDSEG